MPPGHDDATEGIAGDAEGDPTWLALQTKVAHNMSVAARGELSTVLVAGWVPLPDPSTRSILLSMFQSAPGQR